MFQVAHMCVDGPCYVGGAGVTSGFARDVARGDPRPRHVRPGLGTPRPPPAGPRSDAHAGSRPLPPGGAPHPHPRPRHLDRAEPSGCTRRCGPTPDRIRAPSAAGSDLRSIGSVHPQPLDRIYARSDPCTLGRWIPAPPDRTRAPSTDGFPLHPIGPALLHPMDRRCALPRCRPCA